MKYLRAFNESYENREDDVKYLLNMCLSSIEIHEISYGRYGTHDFYLYVLVGDREEHSDREFLKELYQNREILNNIHNLEFWHIGLTENQAIITVKEFRNPKNYNNEYYLNDISEGLLRDKLQSSVYNMIKPYLGNFSSQSNKWLGAGIDYKNGNGGNLALFDWQYDSDKYADGDEHK